MADLPVENLTPEQALNALEVAFATPLTVTYQEHQLSLDPGAVELRYDDERTSASLYAALMAQRTLDGFISFLLHHPIEPQAVPVAVSYSEERLTRYLERIAYQYDHPPQEPVVLPAALDFRSGQPGATYVLVIFLHRPEWLEWDESTSLIADISTATYNHFNPSQWLFTINTRLTVAPVTPEAALSRSENTRMVARSPYVARLVV